MSVTHFKRFIPAMVCSESTRPFATNRLKRFLSELSLPPFGFLNGQKTVNCGESLLTPSKPESSEVPRSFGNESPKLAAEIVSIRTLREHGDFGLGTFAAFDGEMAVLDGHFFQIRGDGTITDAPDEAMAPFAVVTHFLPDQTFEIGEYSSLADLVRQLDARRESENRFYAVRVDGTFKTIRTRAVCKQEIGESLSDAADSQATFAFTDVHGALMGFWTPAYAGSVNIPG
jgi:hypothetical protein